MPTGFYRCPGILDIINRYNIGYQFKVGDLFTLGELIFSKLFPVIEVTDPDELAVRKEGVPPFKGIITCLFEPVITLDQYRGNDMSVTVVPVDEIPGERLHELAGARMTEDIKLYRTVEYVFKRLIYNTAYLRLDIDSYDTRMLKTGLSIWLSRREGTMAVLIENNSPYPDRYIMEYLREILSGAVKV